MVDYSYWLASADLSRESERDIARVIASLDAAPGLHELWRFLCLKPPPVSPLTCFCGHPVDNVGCGYVCTKPYDCERWRTLTPAQRYPLSLLAAILAGRYRPGYEERGVAHDSGVVYSPPWWMLEAERQEREERR
jgi:hypothetical protein